MIEEGTILQKRYRVEKQIGQGGMGSVYLATDERFGSTVAVKETLFTDEHFEKAFKREARLLNSLKHSALPKVSDHFVENNSQYIVMEYIGGDDLFETIEKTNDAFPVDDVVNWTNQLLDALEYLHGQENPVIHRDIKPQNLKLTSHGQIVLLDFGLAKGNPTDANHQTAANSIFGYSRNYASLEQIQGTGTDPRSDLYSLAATVYHLVTGKPPADALTRVMLVLNEEKDPLQPAAQLHDQVPKGLSNALLAAMSLNANQRPQSAAEMRKILSDENYTVPISSRETMADNPAGTNFFSSDTKVMNPKDSGARASKAEMETQVLPGIDTEGKSVRTKAANIGTRRERSEGPAGSLDAGVVTRSYSSKRNMVAASLGGILVLVGSVIGGVYLFSPETFGTGEPTAGSIKENVPAKAPMVVEPEIDPDMANANTSISNTDVEQAEVDRTQKEVKKPVKEPVPAKELAEKKKPTNKTDKRDPSKQSSKNRLEITTSDSGKVIVTDGEIKLKELDIEKDKKKAKDMVVDIPRIKVKPPSVPIRPPITRKEFEKLTPTQKRKVRRALERWRKIENARRKKAGEPLLRRRFPGS